MFLLAYKSTPPLTRIHLFVIDWLICQTIDWKCHLANKMRLYLKMRLYFNETFFFCLIVYHQACEKVRLFCWF